MTKLSRLGFIWREFESPLAAEQQRVAFNVFWEREPMNPPHRRQFLHLAAGAAAVPLVPRIASAQAYPTRPVRVLVGWPAGGAVDIIARLMAQSLSERLRQQDIVGNPPGPRGKTATRAVRRAGCELDPPLQHTMVDADHVHRHPKLTIYFLPHVVP